MKFLTEKGSVYTDKGTFVHRFFQKIEKTTYMGYKRYGGADMIIDEILSVYRKTQSVKATAKEAGCGWQRVVKVLSSNGVIVNETHEQILEMHRNGKSVGEIAHKVGCSIKTVQAYIPCARPYYNIDPSENAKRIKKCREKKSKMG